MVPLKFIKCLSKYSSVSSIRMIACLSALSETHQNFQKKCRDFAEGELKPIAAKIDHEQTFPKGLIEKMADLGLMAITVPKEFGGSGLDHLAFAIATEEISRGCASSGALIAIHNSLYLEAVLKWGSQKQIEHFLVPFTTGKKIGCFALVEGNLGSSISALDTTAKMNGKYYIVNGEKAWVSNGHESAAGIVFALTDATARQKNITAFIFPKPAPGLKMGKLEKKLGICASSTLPLTFQDCNIPKENVLGDPGLGYEIALDTLDGGRIGIAAQAVGISQAALDLAVNYASKRMILGQPIFRLQLIQQKIADMSVKLESARLLTWRAAWLQDNRKPYRKEASMAKLAASEAATFCSHQSIQILGGKGYIKDLSAERHYRDARITEIYVGTSEIQRVIIACKVIREYGF